MPEHELSLIRNFCIIAHIDHGKSTLADRMIQHTGTISAREFRDQLLDDMDIERERGITIKSHPVTMNYKSLDGKTYCYNLIDTPGHVDFAYEVSRSLSACEGALLVVDVGQGVEAQTVANAYMAISHNLVIIPVLNKVDLPNADIEGTIKQIEDVLGIPVEQRLCVSAKTGAGVPELMEAIVRTIPPPSSPHSRKESPVRALIFDSYYDAFRGVVTLVRMVDGSIRAGDAGLMMATDRETLLKEVGIFRPDSTPTAELNCGDVGYVIGTLKQPKDIRVGDTLTILNRRAKEPLPGFAEVHPMVFSGFYPVDAAEYEKFRSSLDKLSLNDSAFSYIPESSIALGFGFRCGFLGLLHMEVVQERLRREFDCEIISTHPAVAYRVHLRNGEEIEIDNPIALPDCTRVAEIFEPMIRASIITHNEHIGDVMRIVMDRRGEVEHTESLDTRRVILTCKMPLNEIVTDFHDMLKSATRGYASLDYEHTGFEASDIVKLDILLNGDPVDAFSALVHRSKAVSRGRQICQALKEAIPPHMFAVPVQAALGRNVIARETIRPFRKDVTAKLYGGDITRKRKLLDKQKEGKRKMKQFGKVNVPQEAFVSVLRST